jgi:L,D-peptidoglycan transpeptidase YkuD (ErfK/YbiS/YcfS/YnhG family)
MIKRIAIVLVSFLIISSPIFAQTVGCKNIYNVAENSLQLLVVTSSDWASKTATLRKYERKTKSDQWHAVGEPIDVVVGKNGMGWGKDLAKFSGADEPNKKEGDGKSPAGLFFVGSPFGFDPSSAKNYRQLKDSTYCVDDQDSKFYNQIIDTHDPKITSNPSHNEKMRNQESYKIGAEIKYPSSRKQATGSCIFMHIWKDSAHGTDGCVAMEEKNIRELVKWLNPKSKPVIVLMPLLTYDKVQVCLGLPSLGNATDVFHLLKFELGKAKFKSGDSITITALYGTRDDITANETYRVEGSYVLTSHDKASLGFYNTTIGGDSSAPFDPKQQISITKGRGKFSLSMPLYEMGYLHVSFYPEKGEAFGGVYFGQGSWVLK